MSPTLSILRRSCEFDQVFLSVEGALCLHVVLISNATFAALSSTTYIFILFGETKYIASSLHSKMTKYWEDAMLGICLNEIILS
jgi:hypothetical protein